MRTVLAAGDHFIRPEAMEAALREEVHTDLDVRRLTLPWPHTPFGPVGEVTEASGTEEELVAALDGVPICVTQMAPFTEKVLTACPDLELVCVGRGGPLNVNVEAATRCGVAVCYAPGRNATATAEHALALMLAAARRVPELHIEMASGFWRGDYYAYDNVGFELGGATIGLVGYGAVGRRVARVLRALDATVIVYDPYASFGEQDDVEAVTTLDELLARSRVVSLHARATPETAGMIGAAQLAAMPQGAVLINCARGSLVDEEAVCDAIETGHLFAAGFDVFTHEPVPPSSRLLTTRHVVMTPHVAGASREVAHKAARIMATEVGRYVRGEPLVHWLNLEAVRART